VACKRARKTIVPALDMPGRLQPAERALFRKQDESEPLAFRTFQDARGAGGITCPNSRTVVLMEVELGQVAAGANWSGFVTALLYRPVV
jgi:hypothetical protein